MRDAGGSERVEDARVDVERGERQAGERGCETLGPQHRRVAAHAREGERGERRRRDGEARRVAALGEAAGQRRDDRVEAAEELRLPPISASTASRRREAHGGREREREGRDRLERRRFGRDVALAQREVGRERQRRRRPSWPRLTPASRATAFATTTCGREPPLVTANGRVASSSRQPRAKTSSGRRGGGGSPRA